MVHTIYKNMVYIFWGDHPFKMRVGVCGKIFSVKKEWVSFIFCCARCRGLPKESHAGTAGWCGKDFFRRSIIEDNARNGEKSQK
jgi:hypothetical protein